MRNSIIINSKISLYHAAKITQIKRNVLFVRTKNNFHSSIVNNEGSNTKEMLSQTGQNARVCQHVNQNYNLRW